MTLAGATLLAIGLAIAAWLFHTHKAQALTNKDTIVLADFDNKTGDAVFDDTLRQSLSVQLEQSPFLSMISDNKINQTLKLMGKTYFAKGQTAALPFYKRAIELDSNFAEAYRRLAVSYSALSEPGLAAEYARKAYERRERVSERERFSIEGSYYLNVTGELEKAAQTYELWQQTYPRNLGPYTNLGVISAYLGNYEKALSEFREALRPEPNNVNNYANLGQAYQALNRFDEAEVVYKQVEERQLKNEALLVNRYLLTFLKDDAVQMERFASAAMGKPGAEDLMLVTQADTQAWYGKTKNARELTRRAMDTAERIDAKETAAGYQAESALREVEMGEREQARTDANAAMNLAPNRDVRAMAALALARAGDTAGAQKLAAELDKAFPVGTLVQRYWLPTIRAAVAIEHKDPNRTVELLEETSATEFGTPTNLSVVLASAYVQGEAYLALGDGNRAAGEFQKFIDHRGLVGNFPWGALARLGLARAYAIQGDTAKAKAAYQDFLTLWKDADPDIPILVAARSEYAKLK